MLPALARRQYRHRQLQPHGRHHRHRRPSSAPARSASPARSARASARQQPASPPRGAPRPASAGLAGTVREGRYELVDVIGAGGMGIVYRARHLAIGNDLAIKVLRSPLVADNQIATRFLQEARFASSIRHSNVVPIFDYGEAPNGAPYYVMDMLLASGLDVRFGHAVDAITRTPTGVRRG